MARESTRLALEQNFPVFANEIAEFRREGLEDFDIQAILIDEVKTLSEEGMSAEDIQDFLDLADERPGPTGLGERFLQGAKAGLTFGVLPADVTPAEGSAFGRGLAEVGVETLGNLVGSIPAIVLAELAAAPIAAAAGAGRIAAPAALGLTAAEATAGAQGLTRGAIAGGLFTGASVGAQSLGPGGVPSGEDAIKELITNTALFGLAGAGLGIRAGRRLPISRAEAEIKALPPGREQLALPPGPDAPLALPEPRAQFMLPERAGPGRPALGESRILEQVPTDLPAPRIAAGRAAVQRPFEVPGEVAPSRTLQRPGKFGVELKEGKAFLRPITAAERARANKAAEVAPPTPIESITEAPKPKARKPKKVTKPSKALDVPESPEAIIREIRELDIPADPVSESIAAIEATLPTKGLPEVAKSLRRSKGRVSKVVKGKKPRVKVAGQKKAKAQAKEGAKALLEDIRLEESKVTEVASLVEKPDAMALLRTIAEDHGLKVRVRKGQGFVEGTVGARKVKVPFNDPELAIRDLFQGRDHYAETGPLTPRELSNKILDYERARQEPVNPVQPSMEGSIPLKCLSPCKVREGAERMLTEDEYIKAREIYNGLEERAQQVIDRPAEVTTLRDRITNRGAKKEIGSKKPFGANLFSPSFYLEQFKEGLQLIRRVDKQLRESHKWISESENIVFGTRADFVIPGVGRIKGIRRRVGARKGGLDELGIKRGTPEADRVGVVLENPEAASLVQPNIRKGAGILRREFSRLFEEVGMLAPGERIGRIKNYLPRLFDRELLRSELRAEVAEFTAKGDPQSLRQATQAAESLRSLDQIGGLTYEQMPLKLRNRFFETRKGRGGYSFDAVKAYEVWLATTSRKVFMEPILRDAHVLIEKLPDNMRGLAVEHVRQATGLDRSVADSIPKILAKVREIEFVRTIGLNPATAVKNATQQLFTIAELGRNGPRHVKRGWEMSLFEEGKAIFDGSGHALDVPRIFLQGRTNMHSRMQRVMDATGWMFNQVETQNRRVTYLAGLDSWFAKNGKRVGMTMETALRRGHEAIPRDAIQFADDLVRKTQFRYGKADLPFLLRQPVAGTALQFSSFAIKAMELMWKWGTREGAAGRYKLAAFLAGAGALQTLGGLAGFPTLADGAASFITVPEMFEAMASVTEGDWARARAAALNTVNIDPLTIGFGPAVSGLQEAGEVLRKVREGVPAREAATRFATNEILPVFLKRVLTASDQLEAGAPAIDFVTTLIGIPNSSAILRTQAIRLVEQGKTQDLREFIRAIRDVHGGLPKDFLSGKFKAKARRELAQKRRKARREKRGETALDRQIRKRFTRTEKLIRNRFVRPIGGF